MEPTGDRQKVRFLPRLTWRGLATGFLSAAAVGAALLFTAGEAEATPVAVPGIGEFEIPDEYVPAAEAMFGFRPVTIPGVAPADADPMVSIPAEPESPLPESVMVAANPDPIPSTMAVAYETAPDAAAPESRSVTVAGLGEFSVPNSLPVLTGIPGVTDSAATLSAPVMVTPKQSTGERAVEAAKSKLGSYYRAGSNGPDSFDCSGLVQWSYAQAGVDLPRTSHSQLNSGTPVGLDELQPGDLVSFYGGGHSALYAGDGKVIHASTYGTGVIESDMGNMPVAGARRF